MTNSTTVRILSSMGKGAETRERILDQAVGIASRDGLEGLTIGSLSSELGLSKSGLFAHFGSKDELQLQVLQAAVARFNETVARPALAAPRGEPRIRAFFERWLEWSSSPWMPGGCLFIAAATELDDRPGPQRDFLVQSQRDRAAFLAKAARMAVEAGHFRPDLDAGQFAFDVDSIAFAYHHAKRLMCDPDAERYARTAFERLLDSYKA